MSSEPNHESHAAHDLPPEGPLGLIGREADLARLEEAFRESSTVVMTGAAGMGKTELACAFARSVAERGENPAEVLFITFQYGQGPARVLHEVGTTLRGIEFAHLSSEQQRGWVVDYVRGNPCLLVWDAFDNVFDYLNEDDCRELVALLQDLSGGAGKNLVTARAGDWAAPLESWSMLELSRLSHQDALHLSRLILEQAQVETKGAEDHTPLVRALEGVPQAMRLVLPHLKDHRPSALSREYIDALKDLPEKTMHQEAALRCSFSRLSARTKKHLPFLALFRQRVLLDVITHVTQGPEYASIMGEELGWGACRTLLREARHNAVLESVSPSVYLMSNDVARFLRTQLERHVAESQVAGLERVFLRVYADMGDYFMENLASDEAEATVTGVLAEEANLLRALDMALSTGDWDLTQLVFQPLAQVYKMQERVLELRRLRRALIIEAGEDPSDAESKGAGGLWLYLQGTELSDTIARNELDEAEGMARRVLAYLESKGDPDYEAQVASVQHDLGMVEQGKGRLDEAEEWYRKALETNEARGNEAESADGYHQLGLVAQSRRQFDEAGEWHRKALEIRERLEDQAEVAGECYQLGLLAEAAISVQEATDWHQRSRTAYENAGDKHGEARACHRLGIVSQVGFDYEEASAWYQRALLIYEELGDEALGAEDYYQMGVLAVNRYDYEEAEEWLRQALGVFQQQEKEQAAANAYHHLGVAAHGRRRAREAEEHYQKALEIMVRNEAYSAAVVTWGQLGLLSEQAGNLANAVWYVAHTYEIAASNDLPILANAKAHLSRLRSTMGTDAFLKQWEQVSDTDITAELERDAKEGEG